MISLTKNQSIPKKYSSIVRAIESASSIDKTLAYYLFGDGIINVSQLDLEQSSNYTFSSEGIQNDEYIMYFKYDGNLPLVFGFSNEEAFETVITRVEPSQFQSFYQGFDETNLVAGDGENRISLPLNVFYRDTDDAALTGFSSPYYNVMYFNGSPQRYLPSTMETITTTGNQMGIGFKNIRAGSIYPEPRDTNDNFSSAPINGATLDEWILNFTFEDAESAEDFFALSFSNMKINSTPRILVAEVFNQASQNIEYLYIPKDVSQEDTNLYYRVDEENPFTLFVSQAYFQDLASGNPESYRVKFYFAMPIEEVNPFSSGSSLSKKYKLPFENILPVGNEFKIFLYDRSRGSIIDATTLSNVLLGDTYNINYETGHLELYNIQPGLLNENVSVFISDIYYEPSIQLDFLGDMANTVAIYGTKGTTYYAENVSTAGDLPSDLYLYAYLEKKSVDFSSYTNAEAKLRTVPQLTMSDVRFLISEESDLASNQNMSISDAGYNYLLIGTLTRSSTTYEFSNLSNNLISPYNKLLQLASQIQQPGDVFNHIRYERDVKITNETEKDFVILNVPLIANALEFYGYLGEISVDNQGIPKNFSAKIVLVDQTNNSETLISEITTNSNANTYFEFVPSSYKDSPFQTESIPNTSGRKYVALKIQVITTPSNVEYDISVNMDVYAKVV